MKQIEIGTIVQILIGEHRGQSGCVYGHIPGLPHEWHVRPLVDWPENEPGIAFARDEITTNTTPTNYIGDEYCWMYDPGGWTCVECREAEVSTLGAVEKQRA